MWDQNTFCNQGTLFCPSAIGLCIAPKIREDTFSKSQKCLHFHCEINNIMDVSGAHVNLQDNSGFSSLMRAYVNGHVHLLSSCIFTRFGSLCHLLVK